MIHWKPTFGIVADLCHFTMAWAVVVSLRFLWALPFGACLTVVAIWALFKEFGFDIVVEQDSWTESFQDFFWYCAGGLAAEVFVWLGRTWLPS